MTAVTAREKFQIGDRVRVADWRGTRGSRLGTVIMPWPKWPSQVRVRRDPERQGRPGRVAIDGMLYWEVDSDAPPPSSPPTGSTSRGGSALHRLVVAAVQHAASIEKGAGWDEDAFIATDTERLGRRRS